MPPVPTSESFALRVLATTDLHMQLMSFNYYSDLPIQGMGLAALTGTITDLRKTSAAGQRHVLLVDNGDLLQGTALGDYLVSQGDRDHPHPVAQAMNELGYVAVGLGNHDLDYGLDYLDWFARDLSAPVVSSNLSLAPPRPWLAPFALVETMGPCVGIVSALPPGTLRGLHAHLGDDAHISNMEDAIRIHADKAREAGADVVLGLIHSGIGDDTDENALHRIAQQGKVDALVGGHTHQVFPGEDHAGLHDADMARGLLAGVPTVMPGFGGALVGCIDLDLQRSEDGNWQVTRASGAVFPAHKSPPANTTALNALHAPHTATCAALESEITQIAHPLTSYFSQVTATEKSGLVAAAQAEAIDAARQGTEYADLPLLSAVSAPRAGGRGGPWNYTDIPAGPLKARHVADLHVYANLIWAVHVTGAQLRDWLEKSAGAFVQQYDDPTQPLVDAAVPSFDFDVVHGVSYDIDPTVPAHFDYSGARRPGARHRIGPILHDGRVVQDDDAFLVAVNSFRACGGGNFPGFDPTRPVLRPRLNSSDVIRDYLASGKNPNYPSPWRFAQAARGLPTWFDTGPGALAYLDDIAHLTPGTPQMTPSGFLRIPITL